VDFNEAQDCGLAVASAADR